MGYTRKTMPARKPTTKKSKVARFTIDCTVPVDDQVLDLDSFVAFLSTKIKVNGKAGALGDSVKIGQQNSKINVDAKMPFSKRYLKYLSKKYLKKQQLRDYLHVISTDPQTYQLRYFNITDAGAD